jgi:hypothetical protein
VSGPPDGVEANGIVGAVDREIWETVLRDNVAIGFDLFRVFKEAADKAGFVYSTDSFPCLFGAPAWAVRDATVTRRPFGRDDWPDSWESRGLYQGSSNDLLNLLAGMPDGEWLLLEAWDQG